jgi:hypothetical protein
MKVAVGIVSSGRRGILSETLLYLERQIRAPDTICVCPAIDEDVDPDLCANLNREDRPWRERSVRLEKRYLRCRRRLRLHFLLR